MSASDDSGLAYKVCSRFSTLYAQNVTGWISVNTNQQTVRYRHSSFMLLYLYVNCTHIYILLTIFVVQYDICCTIRYLFYSTIFVVQYDICCTVRYLLYSTIFVLQYDICCTVQYLLYSTRRFTDKR